MNKTDRLFIRIVVLVLAIAFARWIDARAQTITTASGTFSRIYLKDGTTVGPQIRWGQNTPEGAVTCPVGCLFLRTNGGASTTLYVKESGSGNTGWVAK